LKKDDDDVGDGRIAMADADSVGICKVVRSDKVGGKEDAADDDT
jgi:hypothetical protein